MQPHFILAPLLAGFAAAQFPGGSFFPDDDRVFFPDNDRGFNSFFPDDDPSLFPGNVQGSGSSFGNNNQGSGSSFGDNNQGPGRLANGCPGVICSKIGTCDFIEDANGCLVCGPGC